jgi:hypothetical protein
MKGGEPSNAVVARSGPSGGTLADVLDRVLDKGIVIDAWARLSVVGFEVLSVEARVVVASVETYLKYAQAIGAVGLASKPAESSAPREVPVAVMPPGQLEGAAVPPAAGPSDDEVVGYLAGHADGLGLEDLGQHFKLPRERLEAVVKHLVDERRLHQDAERGVFLPGQGDR